MKSVCLSLAAVLLLSGCATSSIGTGGNAGDARSGKDAELLEASNPRARVRTELAAQYYTRRQFSIALQELHEVLRSDASYAPAYNVLGQVHASLLEDKEADEYFRRAVSLAPEYSEAHNNYGHFLCGQKRKDEAFKHYELAWKNPLYATPEKALANASNCALRNNDFEAAERYAKRALVRVNNQPQALATMAEIHYRQGNLVTSRDLVRRLEAQGKLDASTLWLAVKLERKAGNRDAEADYGLSLRRYYPESNETIWLTNSRYDMPGGVQ
jgi:type IV pilus assembly protein PilF